MTPQETALLLAYIQAADPRFQADEATLAVWTNCLPDDITYQQALQHATHHYQTSDRTILPVHINNPHYQQKHAEENDRKLELLATLPEHDCHNGWIYITEHHPRYGQIEAVKPCPTCQPGRKLS